MHSDVLSYSCSTCQKGFKYPESLERHQKRHPGGSCNTNCTQCGMNFPTYLGLATHVKKRHNDSIRKKYEYRKAYNCTKCERTFRNPAHLNPHEEKCNGPSTKFYNCSHCNRKIDNGGNLRRHEEACRKFITKVENTNVSDSTTVQANDSFSNGSKRSLSSSNCSICKRTFATLSAAISHEKYCSLEKQQREINITKLPVTCSKCNNTFVNLAACRSHEKYCSFEKLQHETSITEQQFSCSKCNRMFDHIGALNNITILYFLMNYLHFLES